VTRVTILALVGVLVAGCASGGNNRVRSDPNELTREEIMAVDARDLYEVIQRVRPRWLNAERRAGQRSFGLETNVVVYQGQMFLGTLGVLRDWSPSAVYRLEWLDGAKASATLPGLGSQHVAGAIILHTQAPEG
jgi:hypothetical protein